MYLARFVELYDSLQEFCGEIFDPLLSNDAMVNYLADIFGKLNVLNCKLQGSYKTLVDSNNKIFGFVAKLDLWRVGNS